MLIRQNAAAASAATTAGRSDYAKRHPVHRRAIRRYGCSVGGLPQPTVDDARSGAVDGGRSVHRRQLSRSLC